MGDITQNLLDTISIMTKHAVSNANFDRTIQAVIMSCEDLALGIYKVRYQDSIWKAYSNNFNTKYNPGTSVYILVPGNDMSKNKTIIGTVSALGEDYVNYISNDLNYIENGNSIVEVPENFEYGLCSYKNEDTKILYGTGALEQNNPFSLNKRALQEYLKTSEYILLKADFRTNLSLEQRSAGNYGLKVTIECNNSTINEQYILDIDNMVGNPYLYTAPLTQKVYFKIDSANIKQIKTIEIFSKDFKNTKANQPNDIFVSNIEILGANTLTALEKLGKSLRFKMPKGYIFTEDDGNTATRTVIAQFRISNKVLSSSKLIQYYWFKQDVTINAGSTLYSKYGGKGWRCLNELNATADLKFASATETFTITKAQAISERTKFKCVVIYKGAEISNTFLIINIASDYAIEITCDQLPIFYPNVNTLHLTCTVRNSITALPLNNPVYYWRYITEYDSYNTLDGNLNILLISSSMVRNYSDFYCSVYESGESGDLIGTAAIRVTKNSVPLNRYLLSIVNGVQVFNYDEWGNSPYDLQNLNHLTIPLLSFTVVDVVTGLDVTDLVKKITWTIPLRNTLLTDQNQVEVLDEEGAEYREYTNLANNFVYGVNSRYDTTMKNNDIKLKVLIHGIQLLSKTNFTFTKEGDLGTNGTGVTCKIVATKDGQRVSDWLVYNCKNKTYNWDNMAVLLWQNRLRIFSSRTSKMLENTNPKYKVTWEFLNHYDNTLWYTIPKNEETNDSSNTKVVTFDTSKTLSLTQFDTFSSETGYPANILKVTVTLIYGNTLGRKYYDTRPIVTIFNTSESTNIITLNNTGFKYVLYSLDGENPQYDSATPFSIKQNNTNGRENVAWSVIGSVKSGYNTFSKNLNPNLTIDVFKNSYNKIEPVTGENNQKQYKGDLLYFKPNSTYNGLCVTNAIVIKGTTFWVHIPIHFMFNKYGHKQLNDWDGNSILIDNEKGFILSPQIGAGIKNIDNSFTGLIMGTSKTLLDLNPENNNRLYKLLTGLFGYKEGERTIFLDAETGKAEFGKQGAGRIIIDPTSNNAQIYGGKYIEKAGESQPGSGMLIDLTDPYIKFGTGNFSVDNTGYLISKTGKIGPWHLTENSLYYSLTEISEPTLGTNNPITTARDYIYLGNRGLSLGSNFIYNSSTGLLTMSVSGISIGGQTPGEIAEGKIQDWVLSTYDVDKAIIQNQLDGKILTFHQDTNPAASWTTNALKTIHKGDLWYCTKDFTEGTGDSAVSYKKNQTYRWSGTGWVKEAAPALVFDAIDGKAQIFTAQPTPPYAKGDLWFNSSTLDIKVCTTARSSGSYTVSDWVKRDRYTDDTTANEAKGLANTATSAAAQAKRFATDYLCLKISTTEDAPKGLYISETALTTSTVKDRTGGNVRLSSDGLHIYDGKEELASYGSTTYFYSWSGTATSRKHTTAATLGSDGLTITYGSIILGDLVTHYSTKLPTSGKGIRMNADGTFAMGDASHYICWTGSSLSANYLNCTGGVGNSRIVISNGRAYAGFYNSDLLGHFGGTYLGDINNNIYGLCIDVLYNTKFFSLGYRRNSTDRYYSPAVKFVPKTYTYTDESGNSHTTERGLYINVPVFRNSY